MNVVDSSAWLSYFSGDKNSDLFAKPIVAIEKLLVPSITLTEVFKTVLRQTNEESAFEAIAHMEQGNAKTSDGEIEQFLKAGKIGEYAE